LSKGLKHNQEILCAKVGFTLRTSAYSVVKKRSKALTAEGAEERRGEDNKTVKRLKNNLWPRFGFYPANLCVPCGKKRSKALTAEGAEEGRGEDNKTVKRLKNSQNNLWPRFGFYPAYLCVLCGEKKIKGLDRGGRGGMQRIYFYPEKPCGSITPV